MRNWPEWRIGPALEIVVEVVDREIVGALVVVEWVGTLELGDFVGVGN